MVRPFDVSLPAHTDAQSGNQTQQPPCYSSPSAVPIPLQASFTCDKGFFCPNSTDANPLSVPQLCPPTIECQLQRLSAKACPPQGRYEPIVCPPKFYCPNDKTRLPCPEGRFCPTGSFEPMECGWMSVCPERSSYRFFYGGIVLCLIIDLALFLLFLYSRHSLKWREKKKVDVENGLVADKGTSELEQGILKAFDLSSQRRLAIDFKFDQLGLTLKESKQTILSGASGKIQAGRVTAIMGPSGAGKTTFMNILMGKIDRTKGRIYVSGKETEIPTLKKVIGYVPQEDIMLRELTVREILSHSARIRLPRDWTTAEIDAWVNVILDALSLSHVAEQLIGDESRRGVSGGQRKRVNIGMELAAAPLVLFADEPTSGLDSTAALTVTTGLKTIANLGMTVVTVLHQPRYEIFKQFDDVIILAPGGRTAYFGPRDKVIEYFESLGFVFEPLQNPADVLMDIVSGKGTTNAANVSLDTDALVQKWTDHIAASEQSGLESITPLMTPSESEWQHAQIAQVIRKRGASFWRQVYYCHQRSLIQQYRLFSSFALEIFVGLLAGGLMGLSTMDSNGELYQGVYNAPYTLISPSPVPILLPLIGFLIGMTVVLAGAPAGVKTFGEEKTVYWREAAAGHDRFAYYTGTHRVCNY